MSKVARQNTILQLLDGEQLYNQEELRKALGRKGIRVTQATLSRDMHELGVVKGPDGYQFPRGGPAVLAAEQMLPSANRLAREFVVSAQEAQNLVVVKTAVGSAAPVAASFDGEGWNEVIGTIAGDDTILMIALDNRSAQRVASRIRELIA